MIVEPPGTFLRMLRAGAQGIGGRVEALGDIDLGADYEALARHVEHYLASPEELSVEQKAQWGALCLYCLASCARWQLPCELLRKDFFPDQIGALRAGANLLRGIPIADVDAAVRIMAQLRVRRPAPAVEEDAVVEAEWASPRPRSARLPRRLRLRRGPDAEPDPPIEVVIAATERPALSVEIIEGWSLHLVAGMARIQLAEEWQEVSFRFRGPGADEVRSADIVGVTGWLGRHRVAPLDEDAAVSPQEPEWAQRLPRLGVRNVFMHLDDQGAITEHEILLLLGTKAGLRSFFSNLAMYVRKVPFDLRIETNDDGRYLVRLGAR